MIVFRDDPEMVDDCRCTRDARHAHPRGIRGKVRDQVAHVGRRGGLRGGRDLLFLQADKDISGEVGGLSVGLQESDYVL